MTGTGGGSGPEARIRVLIAAPLSLFSGAIRAALDQQSDMTVVAECDDCRTVLAAAIGFPADVVLVDAGLPEDGGIEACARIKATIAPTRVLVVGRGTDDGELVAAVEAGADGYLTAQSGLDDLLAAIRHLHGGEAWIPPAMLGRLLRELIRRRRAERATAERLSRLSRREREVLDHLAEGLDPHEIAQKLFVSPHTVRSHVQNLLQKLGLHSKLEAVSLLLDSRPRRPEPGTVDP